MSVKQVRATSSVFGKTVCLHLATFMFLTGEEAILIRVKAVEEKTEEYEFGKVFSEKEGDRILHQKSLLKVSITKAGGFLSPFPGFIKIMSWMLGNVLYAASHCTAVKDKQEEKRRQETRQKFYTSLEREEY